jgi:hypothetical protein
MLPPRPRASGSQRADEIGADQRAQQEIEQDNRLRSIHATPRQGETPEMQARIRHCRILCQDSNVPPGLHNIGTA